MRMLGDPKANSSRYKRFQFGKNYFDNFFYKNMDNIIESIIIDLQQEKSILEQAWPKIDPNWEIELNLKVNVVFCLTFVLMNIFKFYPNS